MRQATDESSRRLALIAISALFVLAFYRTAWVADDAFITFRVVENALNGLGLVWNPGERVQVYTHPLWFGLLTGAVAILGDPYVSALLLSAVLLLATLWLGAAAGRFGWLALACISLLLCSRAFVDYSSSGLENPLTHFLLALFVFVWVRHEAHPRQLLYLSLVASALFLTRPDAIVLVAPAMAARLWVTRRIDVIAVGAVPALAWVAFALFYYGSPVPNTALAKVGTGLGFDENARQAWNYIAWTAKHDPLTGVLVCVGAAVGFLHAKVKVLALGIVLWAFYLVWVGADYMAGRFMSAPVLFAACIAAAVANRRHALILVAVLVVGALQLQYTLFSPRSFDARTIDELTGIADERGFYYQATGMSPSLARGTWRGHLWLAEGALLRAHPGHYARCAIGMAAFGAGPGLDWLDPLALADPLLSRLPARTGVRVGHYERALPPGYLESRISGENLVESTAVRRLYDDVLLATRGSLLAAGRGAAIWRLTIGAHTVAHADYDQEAIGLPDVAVSSRSSLSCLGVLYGGDWTWRLEGIPTKAYLVFPR